jgi:hypothetical protein
MSASMLLTRILEARGLRRAALHLVTFAAGVGFALALAPRATQVVGPLLAVPRSATTSEFHRALQTVMVQMDAAMCITPSADPDRDFAQAMIPHHQGAVDMARLELLYGRDPRLQRLAQGIVVEQSQEIAWMRDILAKPSTAHGRN